jgi:hypothetical protein
MEGSRNVAANTNLQGNANLEASITFDSPCIASQWYHTTTGTTDDLLRSCFVTIQCFVPRNGVGDKWRSSAYTKLGLPAELPGLLVVLLPRCLRRLANPIR